MNKYTSVETEQAVLGSLLAYFNESEYVIPDLNESDFVLDQHRYVFQSIKNLASDGREVDATLAHNFIDKKFKKHQLGINTTNLLIELQEASADIVNLDEHVRELKDLSNKRKFFNNTMQRIEKDAETKSFKELSDTLVTSLYQLEDESRTSDSEIITPKEILEKEKQGLIDLITGFKWGTGYPQVDNYLTYGFAPPMLSIIAARPGIGKSSFKANVSFHQAQQGAKILQVTPEQGFMVEMLRLTAIKEQISLSKLIQIKDIAKVVDGEIVPIHDGDTTIDRIMKSAKYFEEMGIYFMADKTVSLGRLRHLVLQQKKRDGLDIVYIDLLDRIKEINEATSNKANAVATALNFLSRLGMDADVHICGLVQISRRADQRQDKIPVKSDLKDAGAYEEYADLIMGLYREGEYSDEVQDNTIDVIGMKQRNGPTFHEKMTWIGETTTIKPYSLDNESMEQMTTNFSPEEQASSKSQGNKGW